MDLQVKICVDSEIDESEITVTEIDNAKRKEKELGYIRFNRIIRPGESVIIGKFAELFALIYNEE